MFWQTLQATFFAVARIFLISAAGYFCARRKIIGEQGLNRLTRLAVDILLPLFIFFRLIENFSFERYADWWLYPLLGLGVMLAGFAVGGVLLLFDRKQPAKNEFLALMGFQNSGNIPLMVIMSLFSGALQQELFIKTFLFIMTFNLTIWIVGAWLLLKSSRTRLNLRKALNPPFVTIVLTLVFIALGGQRFIPLVPLAPLKFIGNLALPLSMFVVGGNLAAIGFKDSDKKALSLLVAGKMFVMPLLAVIMIVALRLKFSLGFLLLIETAVPSAVTLSLACRYYKIPERLVTQALFVTHCVGVLTVPLFLTIYMTLRQ